ncbi:MAG: anti-sigma factor [Nocardioides sp.]|nr:anti-sigma factor [Nocardioides sp.]
MSVDIHALSGAYAVDALDDLERAAFERHLDECATCRAEVASLTETSALLGGAAAIEPPAGLRDRVLADIAAVRPLPPVLDDDASVQLPASYDAAGTGAPVVDLDHRRRRRLPALVAAAAALVALGATGTVVVQTVTSDPTSEVAVSDPVTRILDADDARTYRVTLDDGIRIEVTRSLEQDAAVLRTTGLSPLPEGQVYQLWFDQGGEMVPAGYLDDPRHAVVMHGRAAAAESANITIENAAGAEHPDLKNYVGGVVFESA